MPVQQRRGYKADLDQAATEPLDEQQQEELIESLKTKNDESNSRITSVLLVLTVVYLLLLDPVATFAGAGADNDTGSCVKETSSHRVALALAMSAISVLGFFIDSSPLRMVYVGPLMFAGLTQWMALSMQTVGRELEELDGLRYKMKGA
ncbi:hypothetical protein BCR33DRAFT_780451 [Rhizoclosmatium globosum]|uniref:Uncharacterized protein n=1 Tax=Rhizoclosmatium globosum TaxID=329046 RepID=A0A1Y2CXB3_9FUNG|nr:hypothetical protein BCR33DRAFT_780451 [Rhizoclosmatium globosum]|eukprot:ORY51484.1 hypothetical protein BCR33DRAFT_780451 [Rhizoclosmatium globosum]